MLAREFTIRGDFPPVSYDEWRRLAEADLVGASFEQKLVTHTYEGIDIQPVYSARDTAGIQNGFPGLPPFVRGARPLGSVTTGWDLCQEHAHPDLTTTNRFVLEDLEGGVTSISLRFDRAARRGTDPDAGDAEGAGSDGVMIYHRDDLDAVLANVQIPLIGLHLEAGGAFLPAAALLMALCEKRGLTPDQLRGALRADPLGTLAREGELPVTIDEALQQMADLAAWTARNCPEVTAVSVDTAPYHHAGATAAQDIALGMATALEYLRAMSHAGSSIDEAARQILFHISVGTHHFLSMAKLRAARRLYCRIVEACGGSREAGAMRLNARTSRRVLTQRDPYVNLLRNTVGVFAAALGGAESITSVPFDSPNGMPDSFSRRVARNTVLILQEEAQLHRVVDPAGGSWFLDQLTDRLADKAWSILQDVERQGGMRRALESGWVAAQIDSAFAPRAKDIARRKEGITGVSEFPDVREQRVIHPPPEPSALRRMAAERVARQRASAGAASQPAKTTAGGPPGSRMARAIEAAGRGESLGQIATALGFGDVKSRMVPLVPRSFAEPFEQLRDASDAWCAEHGHRPRVFLACLGSVAHHTARATYAKNFFEAGGFEVIGNDGFREPAQAAAACSASQATIAVICSSDKLYPEIVPQVAPLLKQAGARTVILAGNPGVNESAWRTAGVDRFIFIKCDVLATLRELLQEEGVLSGVESNRGSDAAEAK